MAHKVYPSEGHCPADINQTIKPQTKAVKYLVLHFDCGLNWKEHIARKRMRIDLKIKEINWLRGKKFHLTIQKNYPPTKRQSNRYGATE